MNLEIVGKAKPKVVKVEELKEKLGQANEKASRLENDVEQLKGKVEEVREARVTKYKEVISY